MCQHYFDAANDEKKILGWKVNRQKPAVPHGWSVDEVRMELTLWQRERRAGAEANNDAAADNDARYSAEHAANLNDAKLAKNDAKAAKLAKNESGSSSGHQIADENLQDPPLIINKFVFSCLFVF
jgi:hypothetical protein